MMPLTYQSKASLSKHCEPQVKHSKDSLVAITLARRHVIRVKLYFSETQLS